MLAAEKTSLREQGLFVNQQPGYAPNNNAESPSFGITRIDGSVSRPHQAYMQETIIPHGAFDAFVNTCQRWELSRAQQLNLLGLSGQDFYGAQLLKGRVPIRTQDVKDRISYVLTISLGLGTIFNESIADELRWLNASHSALDETPLAHMLRGRMIYVIDVMRIVSMERHL